jgi:hypothetical protein
MRFAVALTLAIAFLATPLVCLAVPCDVAKQARDCCPKSSGLLACPYDVLDTAKASGVSIGQAIPAVHSSALSGVVAPPNLAPLDPIRFAADERDLHTRIHILRI